MNSILSFFNQNKPLLDNKLQEVRVNSNKTLIRYGYAENEEININFFISGKLDDNICSYEEKLNHLFNTSTDLTDLTEQIDHLQNNYTIQINHPFMKISDKPLTHALRINIKLNNA